MKNKLSIAYHGRNLQGFAVFSARVGSDSLGNYRVAGYTVRESKRAAREYFTREVRSNLSYKGPYATKDDKQTAKECGISIFQLRQDRAAQDKR